MLVIPGYQIKQTLHVGSRSLVYRAQREADDLPVVLKILREPYPPPFRIDRFQEEYTLTRRLDVGGVIKAYSLEQIDHRWVMVLEDFGGESLNQLGLAGRLPLLELLKLALSLTDTLGYIHQQHIIHRDINPSNIVVVPPRMTWPKTTEAEWQTKIIDFSIATDFLPTVSASPPTPQSASWRRSIGNSQHALPTLEGTLAYISPEQTGRLNHEVDYRTDFYSLGVTLYELLTGRLPFPQDDPLELVHCHIAQTPPHLRDIKPDVPPIIADMVMKLLAKNAAERYQSAYGLRRDLAACLTELTAKGTLYQADALTIDPFPLAQHDISSRFEISRKLYGRESELSTLMVAFKQAHFTTTRPTVIHIEADYGMGVRALLREAQQQITQQHGHFIGGRFAKPHQAERASQMPYLTLSDALSDLVYQLLAAGDLTHWQQILTSTLGADLTTILDICPDLALLLPSADPQPPPVLADRVEVGGEGYPFQQLFIRLMQQFCLPEQPLVLVLDDWQWADEATLQLLKRWLTDAATRHLLLIVAERSNAPDSTLQAESLLAALTAADLPVHRLTLPPLALEAVTAWVAETVQHTPETVRPLTELIMRKTGGNPFFINEFLSQLHQAHLLTFVPPFDDAASAQSAAQVGWQWRLSAIEAVDITANMVSLLVDKFQTLPEGTQQLLKVAACFEDAFSLEMLAEIVQRPTDGVAADLAPALQKEVLRPLTSHGQTEQYRFLHPQLRQAGRDLLDSSARATIHQQIGQRLQADLPQPPPTEQLFEVLYHLNQARPLLTAEAAQVELAHLNLLAAQRAKQMVAYQAAQRYLAIGLDCSPVGAWETQYRLAYDLHWEKAHLAYLNGDLPLSRRLFRQMLHKAQSAHDQGHIYVGLVVDYTLHSEYSQAIAIGREGLHLLGYDLPATNLSQVLADEVAGVTENLTALRATTATVAQNERQQFHSDERWGGACEAILALPTVEDADWRLTRKLLAAVAGAAYMQDLDLFFVATTRLVNWTLEDGLTPQSAYGLSNYGLLLGERYGDYQAGYEFGQVAIRIAEQFQHAAQLCKACCNMAMHLHHWVQPLTKVQPILERAYQTGLQAGELLYVGYTVMLRIVNGFVGGENLELLLNELTEAMHAARESQNQPAIDTLAACQLAILALGSPTLAETVDDQFSSESDFLATCQAHQSRLALVIYQIFKLQRLYLLDQPHEALRLAESLGEEALTAVPGLIVTVDYTVYHALSLLACYPQASVDEQAAYWQRLTHQQQRLTAWADRCPDNFAAAQLLITAEMQAIEGQPFAAMRLYDQAIAAARQHDMRQLEALGNELAGKFWLSQDKPTFAEDYLRRAHHTYQLWGAQRKADLLVAHYPYLIQSLPDLFPAGRRATTTAGSTSTEASGLDLATVLQASQAIAGEILLDRLLMTLMKIVVQNAGAQQGCFLLSRDGQLFIEAETRPDGTITVLQTAPLDQSESLSLGVVNYVTRRLESLVLPDASQDSRFIKDDYIRRHKPRSILCTPLLKGQRLLGVLYLENNLMVGAFTPSRLQVLQMLSAQAAVSIGNARLYAETEQQEKKYRSLFAESHDAIFLSDPQGRIVDANQAARTLFGNADRIGMMIDDLFVTVDAPTTVQHIIRKHGTVRDMELPLQRDDGETRYGLLTITAQQAPDGAVLGYQTVIRDITARRQNELLMAQHQQVLEEAVLARTKELRATLDSLKSTQNQLVEAEKMAALGELVAGVAHEINTPIGVGVTASSVLAEETRKISRLYQAGQMKRSHFRDYLEAADEGCQMILANLNRASELVRSFKQVAVDQSSEERRTFNVKDYLHEIVVSLKPNLKRTNHHINVSGDDGVSLNSYPGDFSQIVTNLVMNSLVHAYEADDHGHMQLDVQRDRQRLILTYADDGIGIPENHLKRIFDPFFSTKWGQGGSGLGMHIVYNIVTQRLKGSIRCESQLGEGTTFIIELPIEA